MKSASRTALGVVLAGLVLMVGGFVLGNRSVYSCGTAFNPGGSGVLTSDQEQSFCATLLNGRGAAAWVLIVGGLAAMAGGLVTGVSGVPSAGAGGPAGEGKPWRREDAAE